MKRVSVALILGIFILATIGSAAVMELRDSDNNGLINSEPRIADISQDTSAEASYNFLVQSEGNEANANPGGTGNANILVLVTYNGAPVTTLKAANFTLSTPLVPPGKAAVKLKSFANGGYGAYTMQVIPITGQTWGAGEYDIIVRVTYLGQNAGQTIASIEVK